MDWTDEDPGLCDTGQLDGLRDELNAWIGTFDTIATNSLANRNVITTDVWSGSSTDAWISSFDKALLPVTTLKAAFEAARDAFDTYRTTVLGIRANAQPWRDEVAACRRTLNMTYASNSDPSPEEEQLLLQQAQERRTAEADLESALGVLRGYGDQREGADNTLAASLNSALPPEWPAQRDALAAVGIDSIAEIANVGTLNDAMVNAANGIIGMDAGASEQANALAALLALYGDDEVVMSAFYQELGGEKTVELVDMVGSGGDDGWLAAGAALVLGAAIRTGLSTASTGWTENQGESFAEGMMAAGDTHAGEIGYLFNDVNNPLGETLAVAMADAIDQWMRVEGNVWNSPSEPTGGTWLSMNENENSQWGLRVLDPSGPVFTTLGQYPDAAFEWLNSSDGAAVPPDEYGLFAADDRVSYWYNTRFDVDEAGNYASNQDELQGISDLFFGALQASGGPTDINGVQTTDAATPWQSAVLSYDIMHLLLENEHFTQDGINTFTSVALAGAFGINMPGFAEYPITQDFYGDIDQYGKTESVTGPGGGTIVVPVFTDAQLAQFLGVAGSHEAGMASITDSIQSYQQTLLNASVANPTAFPMSEAIDRVTSLEAALQGASLGEKIETAAEHDAAIRDAVGVVTGIIGAVPIPGLGEAVGGIAGFTIDWAQDALIGTAYDAAVDGIPDVFATDEKMQTALAEAGTVDRDTHRRMIVATMVYEYLERTTEEGAGFEQPPAPGDFSDPADYFAEAQSWYTAHRDVVDPAVQAVAGDTLDGMSSDYKDTETAYQAYV